MFRDFPLAMHKDANRAAQAAQCAHDQGKFWEYHDKLFENQGALGADQLKAYAAEMGLNAETFNACLDSEEHGAEIRQEIQEGQQIGVSGTPAFFINGRFVSGAQPFEAFASIIDEELESAGASAH